MPKRKRLSSSHDDDEESVTSESSSAAPSAAGIGTRKRRRCGTVSQEQLKQLLEAVLNHKRADGSFVSETFYRLPKRRLNPDYFETVQNPIDFAKIQVNLNTHQYDDLSQLASDIELLVENAKQYYPRSSREYTDAVALWNAFNEHRAAIVPEEALSEKKDDEKPEKITLRIGRMHRRGSEPTPLTGDEESEAGSSAAPRSESSNWTPGELEDALEELFTAIGTATDPEGRLLSTWFQLVPHRTGEEAAAGPSLAASPKLPACRSAAAGSPPTDGASKLPQYYDVIKQPMDLKMVAQRIQASEYSSLSELEADLQLVFRNACTFNEPGSQIYKDAKVLRKLAQTRRAEIEHARLTAAKSSERIRSKRIGGTACLSAELSQLTYDEDEERSSSDSNMSEDNPLWQLFDAVRSHTTPSGFLLSEPFQTLPSRRLYPDYYEEIKNPIALRQIKRKMKDSLYSGIQEMEDDMNLMFENARQYNPPDSKLYKDSIRLQKVLQKKVAEMSADFDEGEEENSEEDSMPLPPVSTRKASQRRDHPVKERCKQLYRTIRDYVNDEGRQLSTVFTELPSRKLYPDYYEIIDSPIDLARIESKIRGDQYESESEILQDFKLMFNNCRQYNEEGSVIYDDANVLERVLMSRVRELGPLPTQDGARHKPRVLSRAQLVEKMWTLFNTIRDHKDATGRQLSLIFVKLPSKLEYPDYFEVIKNPIHLERISQKLKTGTYNTLDEMMADLVLMFDNACKYNEPDSQVYKDALNLHRLALQTKLQLTEDVEEVPDVKTQIQELLTSLFIATYNHQDADGRCFSDSLAELPEHDEVEGQSRVRGISMEIIKRRLDRGLYTRLDVFQEDVFAVLDRARRLSKHDSQTFEDACEMQMFFISYRDELCRSGTLLSSPALSFSQDNLKELIAQLKPEVKNEEDESQDAKPAPQGDAMSFNQIQYCTGEFVYVEPKDKGVEKHIVNIERLWTNNEGQQMMYGCWFFRPEETFHLHTRKFLEKEVFKSDQHIGCPLSQIVGKCAVMSVKDYFRLQPEGYAEQDVYVCESRYSSKSKTFKKIKMYPFSAPPETLREREVPLEPRRVMSVFKKRVEKHKEELAELEECEMKIRTREVPNVEIDNRSAMDGNTYYEQLNTGMLVLKTGDCVYVKSEHSKQVIAQVDTMWTTPDGSQYFHGPTYMTSAEIASSVQQMFYKQEVFVSLLEDTHPMAFVTGKCCVLDYTDYCSRRPTEIPEADVYVCENLFDESKRQIVPRGGDPKRYVHSEAVLEDEVYHFRRLLVLRKQPLATIQQEASERIKSLFAEAVGVSSPAGSKVGDEDSLDGPPASVGSADNASVGTPVSSYKKSKRLKILTGYILYSADIRKKITSNNPSANFGDISRLVGTEWKNLSAAEKASYEERAARMNADSVASLRVEMADTPSRAVLGASLVGPDVVYDCCWLGCDFQYEDMSELIDHCNAEPGGHVPVYAATVSDEYQCQWRGCNRIKKGSTPFPNAGRLMRHVKEVHIQKNNGRVVAPHERGRNFVPRRGSAAAGAAAGQGGAVRQHGPGSGVSTPTSSTGAPEPRFVAAPARPQRLLHSEAYIRYIETLQPERASVPQQQGGWERQLHATPETTPVPDTARLPTHWLADGLADSTSVVKTLWHLRDYLMKDALGISRAYEGRL
ncbi:protein polybromo-1-like isoform X4 [Amphibalanus amphitrite]|uniref:protein polybromo-1-like isoform X4 n=1 Tax=Amphibalanus amphitrite TaxID=1232801 RepID=UPI001C917308|nr:protein polybromo-1-like isoform X4 [Amphibalanus amphitrite]